MRKSIIILLISLFGTALYAQQKLAQTGFQYLSVSQDARATALGGAYATVEGTNSALFYNPAGVAEMNNTFSVSVNYFNFIADIAHASLSAAYRPSQGQYGVFGLSVQSVDYGDLDGTMVAANNQGYYETGKFSPNALAVGIAYARSLTDKFMVGGQIKYVGQHLGSSVVPGTVTKENVASGFAFDFGTIYHTGFKSLNFGMFVRNFSQELKYEEEGFQLPLIFKLGVSMDAMDFINSEITDQSLLLSLDAAHPRSHDEYVNIGMEYKYREMVALRMGYISAQAEQGFSYGIGFNALGIGIDYAFTPFGVFDSVQRFSLSFSY